MATLKPIVEKNNRDGKTYYLGSFRIASYRENYFTKTPKIWINILFPYSITLKEDWSKGAIPAETAEEAESKIKVILDKIIAELSE